MSGHEHEHEHEHEHLVILLDAAAPGVTTLLAMLTGLTIVSELARVPVAECHGTDAEHRQMGQMVATQLRRAADSIESAHTKG